MQDLRACAHQMGLQGENKVKDKASGQAGV